ATRRWRAAATISATTRTPRSSAPTIRAGAPASGSRTSWRTSSRRCCRVSQSDQALPPSSLRLTVLNQFYVPDISPTAHLAASLAEHRARAGDRVTVVTSQGGYVPASAVAVG